MANLVLPKTTVAAILLLVCYAGPSMAVFFSELNKTLVVNFTAFSDNVLHAGKDKLTLTWVLNESFPADIAESYKSVKFLLCYAPVSQKDRKWHKTNADLKKDKTCQFQVVKQPYTGSGTVKYDIKRDIPSAFYFVRAYALDASHTQVAFGQTTNIFEIVGISGRTLGIEISAAVFSTFSVAALVYFYVVEKQKRQ